MNNYFLVMRTVFGYLFLFSMFSSSSAAFAFTPLSASSAKETVSVTLKLVNNVTDKKNPFKNNPVQACFQSTDFWDESYCTNYLSAQGTTPVELNTYDSNKTLLFYISAPDLPLPTSITGNCANITTVTCQNNGDSTRLCSTQEIRTPQNASPSIIFTITATGASAENAEFELNCNQSGF